MFDAFSPAILNIKNRTWHCDKGAMVEKMNFGIQQPQGPTLAAKQRGANRSWDEIG